MRYNYLFKRWIKIISAHSTTEEGAPAREEILDIAYAFTAEKQHDMTTPATLRLCDAKRRLAKLRQGRSASDFAAVKAYVEERDAAAQLDESDEDDLDLPEESSDDQDELDEPDDATAQLDESEHDEIDDDQAQGEWEVDSIVEMRGRKGSAYYLVRWAGYDSTADTWEHESALQSASEAVNAFHKIEVARRRRLGDTFATSDECHALYKEDCEKARVIAIPIKISGMFDGGKEVGHMIVIFVDVAKRAAYYVSSRSRPSK